VNLGADREVTIKETVETIARLVGFEGELRWDPSKPDGQPRRAVDGTRARDLLGWSPTMDFETGLRETIAWYLEHRDQAERAPS
jgi:nucleoside-diphosphate-sugar epimerase